MTYGGYGVSIKKPPSVSAVLLYLRIRGINISQTEKLTEADNQSINDYLGTSTYW